MSISRPVNHRWYWTVFLLSIAVLMLLIRFHVRNLGRQVRREGISSQVAVSARSVLIDVLDIETGCRGYLLANHKDFLRPYFEGIGRLTDDLANLQSRVAANPAEQAEVHSTGRLIRTLLREFTDQVNLVDSHGIEPARVRFRDQPTKPWVDAIRGHLATVQADEYRKVDAEQERLDVTMTVVNSLLDATTTAVILLLLAMYIGLTPPGWPPPTTVSGSVPTRAPAAGE